MGIEGLLAGPALVGGGLIGIRGVFRWAQRRCDEALADARLMPDPAERLYALRPDIVPLSPELVEDQRALQRLLDRAVAARQPETSAS